MQEALDQAGRCSKCGACMGVCPVYGVEPKEYLSARGKLKLMEGVAQGRLAADRELVGLMSQCLLCGRCAANCPSEVDSTRAMTQARRVVASSAGAPFIKRLLLEKALPQPKRLDRLASAGRLARPLLEAALPLSSGLQLRLPGLAGVERLPGVASRPYLSRSPREVPGPKGSPRLGFFLGCVTNYLRPELAEKAVRLLSQRYTVVIPADQGCCGLPAMAAGLEGAAAQLSERFVSQFGQAGVDKIVTVCGSCAHALVTQPPELAPPGQRQAAVELAGKVLEISQVLAEHPGLLAGLGRGAPPAALHHPCHLQTGLKVTEEPEAMLAAAGVERADMEGCDQCCGGAGLFAVNEPELSARIFKPRAEALAASGAQVLVTSCSGCFLQWRRGLPAEIRVCHPIELFGD